MGILYTLGMWAFMAVFWFKIATLVLMYYSINNYKRKEFYYYRNLGVSKKILWISTLSLDIVLFNLLLILVMKIR